VETSVSFFAVGGEKFTKLSAHVGLC